MNLDPSKDPVGVQILRDTAAEQAAKIQQLEWELSYLRRQLEGEGACRPDAPASGNGANAPTSASEPSGSRGTNLGLTTPPPSAGRPSTSSPDVEEEEAQNDQENSGSIAQRLRRRKRQSPVESPCVTRSRKRVIRPDPDDQVSRRPRTRRRTSQRKKVEVVVPPLTPEVRARYAGVPRALSNSEKEDGGDAEEEEEEDKGDDGSEFAYSTLSELSESEPPTRPQSPTQEPSPQNQQPITPVQESRDGEVPMEVDSAPTVAPPQRKVVYHLRSPSRELSYFDPEEEERRGAASAAVAAGPSLRVAPVQDSQAMPQRTVIGQPFASQPTFQSITQLSPPDPIPQQGPTGVPQQSNASTQAAAIHPVLSLAADIGLTNVVFRPILRLRPPVAASSVPSQPTVHAQDPVPTSPPTLRTQQPTSIPAGSSPAKSFNLNPQATPQSPGATIHIVPQAAFTNGHMQNTTISPQGVSASCASFGVTGTPTLVQTASTTHMPALTTPYPPSPALSSSSTQSPGAPPQSQTGQISQRSCVPLVLAGVRVKCAPALMTEEAAADRLSGCRQFDVPVIDPELRSVSTARSFLASAFGGNGQQPSTVARNGDNFLFPKFEMQPNLPYAFGMPGLLYSASFMRDWKEGRQKLFVGLREGHVWYVGDYVLDRGLALSAEEYRAWPKEMKFKWATYIRTTKKHRDIKVGIVMRRELNREPTEVELASAVGDKNKYDDLRDSEIILAYEEGREVMNVWRMQCVGFDVKFLQAIHEKHNNYVPVPRVKREKKPVASNNAPPGL